MTDLNRLGKRGSYRLGQLRTQGGAPPGPPPPLRPRFRRARQPGPTALWLLAAAGTALIAAGAAAGLWFVPFVVGLAAGLASRIGGGRPRVLVPAVAAAAVAGWGIPLCWPVLRGQPAGGTARVIGGLAGLPGSAAPGVLVTLLVAVLLGLAGLWLGRALAPHSRTAILEAEAAGAPGVEAEGPDVAVLDVAVIDVAVLDVAVIDVAVLDAAVLDAAVLGAGAGPAGVPRARVLAAGVAAAGVTGAAVPPDSGIPDVGDTDAGGGSGRQPGPAGPTMGE
jgi:hypothetical protein